MCLGRIHWRVEHAYEPSETAPHGMEKVMEVTAYSLYKRKNPSLFQHHQANTIETLSYIYTWNYNNLRYSHIIFSTRILRTSQIQTALFHHYKHTNNFTKNYIMGCNIFSRKHVAGIPWGEAPARKVSTAQSGRTSVSTRGRQSLSVPGSDPRSRSRSVHGDIIGNRGSTIGGGH